jgi:hypothetical protein
MTKVTVMAGLDPAIHVFSCVDPAKQAVDARVKPGHDVERFVLVPLWSDGMFSWR